MRQATSQEPVSDSGHSLILESSESNASSSLKSAAMLGIALSVGASGALVPSPDAAAATSAPATSTTTEAFSSNSNGDSQVGAEVAAASAQQIVAYHTIASGESLWQIAQQHRVGLQDLKSANALAPETSISVGQVLKVPASSTGVSASELLQRESVKIASTEVENLLNSTIQPVEADSAAAESASRAVLEMTVTPEAAPPVEIADASLESVQPDVVEPPVVTAYAPTPATNRYQVRSGDTLRSIASSLGTTPEAIVRANALIDPDIIFVGSTLVVPTSQATAQPVEKSVQADIERTSEVRQPSRPGNERLAYLRDTATAPESARVLEEMRSASPEAAASVGGEEVTKRDLLGSVSNSDSRDPYVANLLAEVEEIRTQAVQVSEASVEIDSDALVSEENTLLARANASDRISRLSLPGRETATVEPAESVDLPQADSADVDSDLLAAAPISPDAYIPAQRSPGQVVSPDMPILPSEDEYLPEAPNFFDGYMWPTQGTVTSGYGWRWGRMHRGVDVAGPVGTPIVAAAAGVVERAGWSSGGFGNLVEIRHPDGSLTRYAHNNSVSVSEGQSVEQGQLIAEMGSTGYSTGPHLHFELHQGGSAVNPVAYLPGR